MSIGGTFRAGAIPAGTSVAAGGVIALAGLPALASIITTLSTELALQLIFTTLTADGMRVFNEDSGATSCPIR